MRKFLLLLLYFSTVSFSTAIAGMETDSVLYNLSLVKFNKNLSNYKNCLKFSQKALDYAKKHNNQQAVADSYSNLGCIYLEIEKFDDAQKVLIKSIAIYATLNNSEEKAFAHYNLGICYLEKDNFVMAEKNFDIARLIYNKLKINFAIDLLNFQKAIIYKEKGKLNMALPIFESLISKDNAADSRKLTTESLYQIGTIQLYKNRNDLALTYLNKALELSNADKNLESKSKIVLALSEAFEKTINIKKSLYLLKQYLALKDSLDLIKNKKIGVQDFERFKESEKLKLIEKIDKENKNQKKTNSFAKLISILAIALISILSLLSLSLYKNNVIRNFSNSLLKEKNNELFIAKEKAEKASKARVEFLSTVSHELRTPLNAITGITHLLLQENPNESQIDYLNSLKFSGNYLLTFINDILEINRIESNNIPIENIPFNLTLLLTDIQNSFKEIALENKNIISLEIDENIPVNIIGDITKLSQIFMNLINNSLKFTKNGFVKVIAQYESIEVDTVFILFKVTDNGIGIPEDKQAEIFNSFSQGSIEINRKYGGTGLGLAIVKRLVELLGGSIYLNSKVALGTTFSFTLPLQVGEKIIIPVKEHNYDLNVLKNKNILLVEDNKINQMITKKILENRGMFCVIVDNGEESVAVLRNQNVFDLVLMDIHLPGINGTIATQQIREFNMVIPIIALTAISLNENRDSLLSYGMTDVLKKPFDPEFLYKVIAENVS